MMNKLHNSNNNQEQCCNTTEMSPTDHEKHFARLVAADIAGNLQVNYGDRDVVVKLLTSALEKLLCNRNGLLEQYLHTQLDVIANTIRTQFLIPDDVSVDYGYATHAKLNNILRHVEGEDQAEDGDDTKGNNLKGSF